MRRRIAALALGGAALFAPLVARAQGDAPAAPAEDPREASRAAYRRGVAQYESGNYPAARDSFLEAYRLFAHPSILYNLGLARLRTREYLLAERDLLKFLEDDGGAPPQDVSDARRALAEVRQHLGTFLLRVAPTGARAQLDAQALALIPGSYTEVRTTVGAHALRVDADGYAPAERTIDVANAGPPAKVDLDLQRPEAGAHVAGGGEAPAGASGRATAGWILVGASAASAGFSLFAALRAKSLADDYDTPNSGAFQDPSTRSTGITFRTLADVAGGAALVAAGVGVYLLLTPDAATSRSASVVLGPAYAGVSGRF